MELDAWGNLVFRQQYVGSEERDGVVFYKFTIPTHGVSNIKIPQKHGYSVCFVTCWRNIYVQYIAVDKGVHPDPQAFLKKRLSNLVWEARTRGWNKRLTAEAEALSLIL